LQAVIVSTAYKIAEGKPKEQLIAEIVVLGATQAEAEEAYRLAVGIVNTAKVQGGRHHMSMGLLTAFIALPIAGVFYLFSERAGNAVLWLGLLGGGATFIRGAWRALTSKGGINGQG
jgi:hypothetical protein